MKNFLINFQQINNISLLFYHYIFFLFLVNSQQICFFFFIKNFLEILFNLFKLIKNFFFLHNLLFLQKFLQKKLFFLFKTDSDFERFFDYFFQEVSKFLFSNSQINNLINFHQKQFFYVFLQFNLLFFFSCLFFFICLSEFFSSLIINLKFFFFNVYSFLYFFNNNFFFFDKIFCMFNLNYSKKYLMVLFQFLNLNNLNTNQMINISKNFISYQTQQNFYQKNYFTLNYFKKIQKKKIRSIFFFMTSKLSNFYLFCLIKIYKEQIQLLNNLHLLFVSNFFFFKQIFKFIEIIFRFYQKKPIWNLVINTIFDSIIGNVYKYNLPHQFNTLDSKLVLQTIIMSFLKIRLFFLRFLLKTVCDDILLNSQTQFNIQLPNLYENELIENQNYINKELIWYEEIQFDYFDGSLLSLLQYELEEMITARFLDFIILYFLTNMETNLHYLSKVSYNSFFYSHVDPFLYQIMQYPLKFFFPVSFKFEIFSFIFDYLYENYILNDFLIFSNIYFCVELINTYLFQFEKELNILLLTSFQYFFGTAVDWEEIFLENLQNRFLKFAEFFILIRKETAFQNMLQQFDVQDYFCLWYNDFYI